MRRKCDVLHPYKHVSPLVHRCHGPTQRHHHGRILGLAEQAVLVGIVGVHHSLDLAGCCTSPGEPHKHLRNLGALDQLAVPSPLGGIVTAELIHYRLKVDALLAKQCEVILYLAHSPVPVAVQPLMQQLGLGCGPWGVT